MGGSVERSTDCDCANPMQQTANALPAVRVELRGGLGNQLFQAAAAYALSQRLGGALQFELFNFRDSGLRGYALAPYPHRAKTFKSQRSLAFRLQRKASKLLKADSLQGAPDWRGAVFEERSYRYDARITVVRGPVYLRGYFQSWRYFDDHAAALKDIFDPARAASEAALRFAGEMGPHAIAVHVRAGDFLNAREANLTHGTLTSEYYDEAFEIMRTAKPDAKVFCFSDSPDHARQVLRHHSGVHFVQGFSMHDDMYLMSRAAAIVIANSTFSYWSAWLSRSAEPIVVAPKAWLTPEALARIDTQDLYPPDWIIV